MLLQVVLDLLIDNLLKAGKPPVQHRRDQPLQVLVPIGGSRRSGSRRGSLRWDFQFLADNDFIGRQIVFGSNRADTRAELFGDLRQGVS